MLQWLHTYVASVLFQMFQMLQKYVARVLSKCCIYLEVFHPDVAYVSHMLQVFSSGCCTCSAMATHVFPWCFIRMLQVFYLDVAKVDLVLHMSQ
jgi:hypothetical protein